MILRNYPESITELQNNFIIHFTTNKTELDKHISPLSLKCLMKGREEYGTNEGRYTVTPGTYLIVNEGQECSSSISSESETFSVYFDQGFANDVLQSLVTPGDKFLNYSFMPGNLPVQFLEKLYSHNNSISPLLMKLRLASKFNFDNECFIKETFYELLEKLLFVHRELYKEIDKLPPLKLSTKTELYKRVCRAKEYIDSSFTEDLTLEKLAKEACLSRFHFLRLFKTIYNKTPHRYLTEKRIEKAVSLLFTTDMSITEICFEIGFGSLSSFSWLFRNKFGLSPGMTREQYRRHISSIKL